MSSKPNTPLNDAAELETPVYVPAGSVDRQLPEQATTTNSGALHDTAESVGAAMGKAVGKVRELPRRMAEMRERFTVIRGRAREDAASRAVEMKETAKLRVSQAQTRAEYYAHEYPIQFILGVGATAFVLGFILRIWRSSRRG